MRRICLTCVITVFVIVLSACTTTNSDVPLPSVISIESPQANVPEKYSRFLGKWGPAKWDKKLEHILLVERMNARGEALAIYAYGKYSPWDVTPNWFRKKGRVTGNKLRLDRLSSGAEVTYEFMADGTLFGTYDNDGKKSTVKLRKSSGK